MTNTQIKETVIDVNRTPWTYWIEAIEQAELLTVPHHNSELTYIFHDLVEFYTKCPRSWFPDHSNIKIAYVPNKLELEEVSLKLFTNKFASFRWGHETAVNEYMNAIIPLIEPKYLIVWWNFSIRWNVKTIPFAYYSDPSLSNEEKERIESFIWNYLEENITKTINHVPHEF